MRVFAKKEKVAQGEFWVATHQLPQTPKATYYARLDETLESFGFADQVRALCAPAYKQNHTGRPGIDPVVYLKMIMIGFFEDLPSERAIAARCADSMSIRAFLNYSLEEKTPDHSSFTIIRQRLGLEIYQQIFTLTVQALREHGLLRGKNLGIDSVFGGEPLYVLPILFLSVAMHQSAQRSIGFNDRRIDAQILATQQTMFAQGLQSQREDLLINLQAQTLANDREAGVIRRRLLQRIVQKGANGHRVGAARGDRSFAGKVLEKPNHDHLQIDHRINPRAARLVLFISRRTDGPDPIRETERLQGLIEPRIKGCFRRLRKLMSRHPELALRYFLFLREHAHFLIRIPCTL